MAPGFISPLHAQMRWGSQFFRTRPHSSVLRWVLDSSRDAYGHSSHSLRRSSRYAMDTWCLRYTNTVAITGVGGVSGTA